MCGCPVTSLGNKFKISTKLVLEYTVTCLIVIKINPIATKKKTALAGRALSQCGIISSCKLSRKGLSFITRVS